VLGVKVGGQFACLGRVGDSGGERFLEPLRGTFGRVGQCRLDGHLGEEGQVDQGFFAPVGVQREQFDGGDPQLVHRHAAGGAAPDPVIDAFPDSP
jgi:hypothetical protein